MGKSSSSSQANQSTTTTNQDNRIANGSGASLSNVSGSTIQVQTLDPDIVNKALDTVQIADATNGEGFSKLLDIAGKVLQGGADMVNKSQDTALAAMSSVNADNKGTLDQKTIMVLAGAAAVAAVAMSRRK